MTKSNQERSDYNRLHRMPFKTCRGCGQSLPNDRDHFSMGPHKLRSTCHECMLSRPVPTKAMQKCPCCTRLRRLYQDKSAPGPAPLHVCRPCLMLMNAIDDASRRQLANALDLVSARRGQYVPTVPLPPKKKPVDGGQPVDG